MQLIAVGERPPAWIDTGFRDYAERLPRAWRLRLVEIAPAKRRKKRTSGTETAALAAQEGERILAVLPDTCHAIALAVGGRHWDTPELARQLEHWLQAGRDLAWVIGGPDGLSDAVTNRCETHWSLSRLTFPHALARVLVAEQLYRAWSLLNNHPYHRA